MQPDHVLAQPSVQPQPQPIHNNIPATFVGHESGPIVWLCATELRDGEEDHYLQYAECPATLIK